MRAGLSVFHKPSSSTQKRFNFQGFLTYASAMHNATHWLTLAEDARKLADRMRDPKARELMLVVALAYATLARYTAQFAATSLPVKGAETKSD